MAGVENKGCRYTLLDQEHSMDGMLLGMGSGSLATMTLENPPPQEGACARPGDQVGLGPRGTPMSYTPCPVPSEVCVRYCTRRMHTSLHTTYRPTCLTPFQPHLPYPRLTS